MHSTLEKVLLLKSIDLFSQIRGEALSQVALVSTEVEHEPGDGYSRRGNPATRSTWCSAVRCASTETTG